MLPRTSTLSAFLALLLSTHSPAAAEPAKLKFGILELPPLGMVDAAGNRSGVFHDIGVAVAKEAGYAIETRIVPTRRLRREFRHGHSDCSIFIRSKAADEVVFPVTPLGFEMKTAVVTRPGVVVERYEDLYGVPLAFSRSTKFGHKITTDPKLNRYLTDDYMQSTTMLKAGRVDAMVGTLGSLAYTLKKVGMPLETLPPPLILNSLEVWLYCREELATPAFMERFGEAAGRMAEKGVVERVWERYLE